MKSFISHGFSIKAEPVGGLTQSQIHLPWPESGCQKTLQSFTESRQNYVLEKEMYAHRQWKWELTAPHFSHTPPQAFLSFSNVSRSPHNRFPINFIAIVSYDGFKVAEKLLFLIEIMSALQFNYPEIHWFPTSRRLITLTPSFSPNLLANFYSLTTGECLLMLMNPLDNWCIF